MPSRIVIYEALISCLKDACSPGVPGRKPRDAQLHTTLDGYLLSMASDNVVSGIVESVDHLKTLLEVSVELGLANDRKLRLALHRDGERIATLLRSIFASKSLEEAVLRLEGDSAQCFLDVVQNTLDKGFLLAPEDGRMARRIIRKLACSADKLPSTLFITGITGKEEHPAFGGGFADIYRASYKNRTVALKYMRVIQYMRGSDSRNVRLKFCREALVWKELCHPHILPFLGIEENSFPSPLCMVSPWMEHGTVLNYLKQHGHSNVDKLLYEIAQGLQYLHSRDIVHGDLRGANILINDDWSACLADFGLSIFSDATSSLTTNRGGSPYWMAPELLDPDRFGMRFARTPASDVYSFGCMCLELYTGRPPFSGLLPEPGAMMKVINGERPPRPSSSPAMSDSLWNYVSTYWAQDPKIRPVMQIVTQNMIWPRPPPDEERPAVSRKDPHKSADEEQNQSVRPSNFENFLTSVNEGERIVSDPRHAAREKVVAGPFFGHTSSVSSVAFSPDASQVVSSSDDNTVRLRDTTIRKAVTPPFIDHTSSVAFSPDGGRVVSGSDDATVLVWDAVSGEVVAGPFTGHTSSVSSVAFSPDGGRVVSGSDDTTVLVWDAVSREVVAGPFTGHTSSVSSVAFSPDGRQVVSGSDDKTMRVWDVTSEELVSGPLTGHTSSVSSVAFSPDGSYIISGSYDKTVRMWDVQTGQAVMNPFVGHTSSVSSVAFSPDGRQVVSGSYDKTVRVWDVASEELVSGPLIGHTRSVSSVAFSPDGSYIASGSYDKTVRKWDVQTGQAVMDPFVGHTSSVSSVAFSPDGKHIVSGSDDKTVLVWDTASGEVVAGPFMGHTSLVSSVAFSPDGRQVVSGSRAGELAMRRWKVDQSKPKDLQLGTIAERAPATNTSNGVPLELGRLPHGQYPDPVGDIFGAPPVRRSRASKFKVLPLRGIVERPYATRPSELSVPGSPRDEDGDGPKKVPEAQINALAKMLSALRR
ncbi:Kinase-like protein [Mycena sanguinolenta]|uniref:Kinase-like protein n=1 Tax=Mycena sanguinolenta TaxID=230812 RepID=A0A8H6Z8H0_9AGAR|nr:Kinase-like protein [Mycena sanguinolenta]